MATQKLAWLDNIRVLSILLILSFHFWIFFYGQPKSIGELTSTFGRILAIPLQLGWEADCLFFVISGLGLGMSAMRNKRSWTEFFIARAKRIYIPYWLSISVLLIVQVASVAIGSWLRPAPGPYALRDWVFNLFLVPANSLNLFSSHYWFLYTLIELYVLFPAIFLLMKRFRWLSLAALTVVHLGFVFAQPLSLGILSQASSVFLWGEAFCLGVLIGILLVEKRAETESLIGKLLPLGVLALVLGSMSAFYGELKPFQYILLSVGTFVVGFAISKIPVHLEYLSKISFGAYLIHMPFIGLYRFVFGFLDFPTVPMYLFYMVTTCIMGAALTWAADHITDALSFRTRAAGTAQS